VLVREDDRWENADTNTRNVKRPSEINHGPILFGPSHGGATFREAEQTVVLTLAGLRWLRFPPAGEKWKASDQQRQRDEAARLVLAATGLAAAVLASEAGHDLRSGCLLHGDETPVWELLDRTSDDGRYELAGDNAVALLDEAIAASKTAGIRWRDEPLVLHPSDDLVELIRRSQELAKAEEGGES